VEYDDNVDEFGVLVPIEEISEEVCIKFCENTEVTFSLSDPDGNIDSILWDQAGGITSSANQNPDFTWYGIMLPIPETLAFKSLC
jgi:hypothetical protein